MPVPVPVEEAVAEQGSSCGCDCDWGCSSSVCRVGSEREAGSTSSPSESISATQGALISTKQWSGMCKEGQQQAGRRNE
jgi:hypothetical protein